MGHFVTRLRPGIDPCASGLQVEVYDGYQVGNSTSVSSGSSLIGTYCGNSQIPPQSTSLTRQMTIAMRMSGATLPPDTRFSASYAVFDSTQVLLYDYVIVLFGSSLNRRKKPRDETRCNTFLDNSCFRLVNSQGAKF